MSKHQEVFRRYLLLLGLLLVGFVIGGMHSQTVIKAAGNPLVYTGTKPNTNVPTYNNLTHELYFSVTGKDGTTANSNYAALSGSGDQNDSVIESQTYQSVVEHFKATNISDKAVFVNEIISLPRYYGNTSNVVYAGDDVPKIETHYNSPNQSASDVDISYMYLKGNTSDLQDLYEYRVMGTLQPGDSIEVNTPLKVLPRTNNSIDGMQVSDFSYQRTADGQGWNTQEFGLLAHFGKYVSPLDYWNPENQNVFIATIDDSDGLPILAKDVQDLMPIISRNLDAFTYSNIRGETIPAGGAAYTGSTVTIHLAKLKGLDGQTPLTDELHNEGYAYNILSDGTEQPTYTFTLGTTGGSIFGDNGTIIMNETKYNGRTLGDAYLYMHKLIDAKNETYPVSSKTTWDPNAYKDVQFYDINGKKIDKPANASYMVQKIDANGTATEVANNEIDMTKDGVYQVTYIYPVTGSVTVKKTITITVGKGNSTPVVPGGGGSSSTPTTPAATTPSNNSNFSNGTKNTTEPAVPNYAAKEGAAVYATKKIYLYKNATFKKAQRIATYPKAKRVNRPMFVVTDYARSKGGALRYKVRDVNHGSKTAGKVGYITANRKYVVPVYYASMPKDKKITIISKKGVNAYRNVNLTKKVKHYKKGAHLTVKKIVKHRLTSRYVLSNGSYVTANKKLIIQGNY